ncbi:MAG: zinc-binding dehydrogenase [Alphaproteobacteria bacterium]
MAARDIRDDLAFSEYGVDSIVALSLVRTVNETLKIDLPTIALFDYNNVEDLAAHILKEYPDCLLPPAHQETANSGPIEVSVNNARSANSTQPVAHSKIQRKSWLPARRQKRIIPEQPSAAHLGEQVGSGYWRVLLERPGEIRGIRLVKDAVPELHDDEIRIAVRAFSLNFGDLLCVRGLYPTMPPYPFTPGSEVSGIVTVVGQAVTSVKAGDEVIALMGETMGGHATVVTCPERMVLRKPASLSFEEACALPSVSMTMIEAFRRVQPESGEKILIQTAAGGTGLVAVQLAKHVGATIYATAGSQEKLDYLSKFGIEHLINYREADFEEEIHRLTGGEGVDVVINTLSGDAIQKGLNCLTAGGRYVEIAMTALRSSKPIDMSALTNNQSFYSIDMRRALLGKDAHLKKLKDEFVDFVERGIIRPTISEAFPFDRVTEAYECLDNRAIYPA